MQKYSDPQRQRKGWLSAGVMDRKEKELVCNGNPDIHDVDDLQPWRCSLGKYQYGTWYSDYICGHGYLKDESRNSLKSTSSRPAWVA